MVRVFGLDLEQQYADLFISSMSVYSPHHFSKALSECSTSDIKLLENILVEYYRSTEFIRESGASNLHSEAVVSFFSAASAPVIAMLYPRLALDAITLTKSILLAQYSYVDRRFDPNINAARGYMVERLITQGNRWERPLSSYNWLGANYRRIAPIAYALEERNSVEKSLVKEMMRSNSPMVAGSL